jgi:hypothetical protein
VSRFYPHEPDVADLLLVAATERTSEDDMTVFEKKLAEALR